MHGTVDCMSMCLPLIILTSGKWCICLWMGILCWSLFKWNSQQHHITSVYWRVSDCSHNVILGCILIQRLMMADVSATQMHTHSISERSFYRYVIVYVSLAASVLGLFAVFVMKALELWQSRNYSTCKETEPQTAVSENHCNYGAIQNGKVYRRLCPIGEKSACHTLSSATNYMNSINT